MKTKLVQKVMNSIVISCMICSFAYAHTETKTFIMPPKKTVAVADFEIKTGGITGEYDLSKGMAEMLTDALMQSGQFIVLERQTIDAVLAEQNFAASNRTSKIGGAKSGDIKRAQVLIQGVVTEYDIGSETGGQEVNIGGFRFGGNKVKAHIGLIIRLIDTTTSEVIASQRVEGSAKQGGTDFSVAEGGFDFSQSGQKRTPINKAVQITIDNAVNYIAMQMKSIPWKGKVIKTTEAGAIYVNAGISANIQKGMMFMVFRPGEELIDPDTGMNLGTDDEFVGRMRVTEVLEKFSKATALDASPQKGDIVKFAQ
ncbi:CsgG/HfaB family protein [Candidatus Omnitrophota bacterium]